ncbi:MAG TPA: class IV adenylate cyclase [Chitinophagaceae bacterium]|nr:class IV adenylate cyclase [Chitinophagaceae bacterium]HPG11135.1 class IV adenylate cyclase [Chitinophagaceae bacterium]HRX94021.1 class IV adenylate cyclase [Chitinophagaceae bacterium]
MSFLNVEIKAKCSDPDFVRTYLNKAGADFKGTDLQTDTYFKVPTGRLKIREGNIENSLIYYQREDNAGPKNSHFHLIKLDNPSGLKEILVQTMGVKVIVQKAREIYYIRNVKFHIDKVDGLGSFLEIEAGNILADLNEQELAAQCNHYLKEFKVREADLIKESYSDILINRLADNDSPHFSG